MAWLAGVVALALPFGVGTALRFTDPQPEAEVVTTFRDPAIAESSGLVVLGDRWVTVNDSGDSGRIFVVDPKTGRTERTITYHSSAVDVEALAPEGDEVVWVGDIGDNLARRDHISLYRVPLDGGKVTRIDLRYPDGPRDAETLLRHPVSGDLFVLSKQVLGGTVYRVPAKGTGTRTLVPLGRAPALLTDGGFSADGSRVYLRNYGRAFQLDWPSWEVRDSMTLPRQRQGEALAVEPGGTLLLGSEGRDEPVLRIPVFPVPRKSESDTSPTTLDTSPTAVQNEGEKNTDRSQWYRVLPVVGLFGLLMALALIARRRIR